MKSTSSTKVLNAYDSGMIPMFEKIVLLFINVLLLFQIILYVLYLCNVLRKNRSVVLPVLNTE